MTLYKAPKKVLPKVGQQIYVPTSLYIDHGEDDVIGGRATISLVEKQDNYVWIHVKELPGRTYNLEYLLERQEDLKKEFGRKKAYPDPDLGSDHSYTRRSECHRREAPERHGSNSKAGFAVSQDDDGST
jgi:hypothetical protein